MSVTALAACKPKDDEEKETAGYVTIDIESFCPLFVDCAPDGGSDGGATDTAAACKTDLGSAIVPPSCNANFKTATCANYVASLRECFPACTYTDPKCDGDNSLQCLSGREFTNRCETVCALKNLEYTGTCGTKYALETSNKPVCWCRKK